MSLSRFRMLRGEIMRFAKVNYNRLIADNMYEWIVELEDDVIYAENNLIYAEDNEIYQLT